MGQKDGLRPPWKKGQSGNPKGRPKKANTINNLSNAVGIVGYSEKALRDDIKFIGAMSPCDRRELAAVGEKGKAKTFRGQQVTSNQVMLAKKWGTKYFDKLYTYVMPRPVAPQENAAKSFDMSKVVVEIEVIHTVAALGLFGDQLPQSERELVEALSGKPFSEVDTENVLDKCKRMVEFVIGIGGRR